MGGLVKTARSRLAGRFRQISRRSGRGVAHVLLDPAGLPTDEAAISEPAAGQHGGGQLHVICGEQYFGLAVPQAVPKV